MALDERRNLAYLAALKKLVTPDSVVLDLGAGLGTLGLLAARIGARRVYLVEPEDLIEVARSIAAENGLSDRVCCLHGPIEEVEMPEKVDVLVSTLTGNFLLAEDLLPSLFFARDRHLAAGGTLLPDAAVMEAAPVSIPRLHSQEIESWSEPHLGLHLSAARQYAANSLFFRSKELRGGRFLAAPRSLLKLDLHSATSIDCRARASFTVEEGGLCHGLAGWFRMRLAGEWLSTSPLEPPLHWSAAYLPLDPPIPLQAGEGMEITLIRPARGDWTWSVETPSARQRRSTFLSTPRTAETLRKADLDFAPRPSELGKMSLFVLERMDGQASIRDLAAGLERAFPGLPFGWPSHLELVQYLVRKYG